MSKIEKPSVVQRGAETLTTHPAFGQIIASRVSGSSTLYGSEFRHHNYITVSICRSELHRDLSRDWHYGTKELIEVKLSEAQWASFVSAMNVGSGVPCTINHLDGKPVADLPDPEPPTLQFQEEMRKTLEASTATLQKLLDAIDEMGLPKGKAEAIKSQVRHSMMQINCNAPFVAKSFRENKRPGLSNLRDSGEIEQNADGVFFAFRPSYYLERTRENSNEGEMDRQELLRAHGGNGREGQIRGPRLHDARYPAAELRAKLAAAEASSDEICAEAMGLRAELTAMEGLALRAEERLTATAEELEESRRTAGQTITALVLAAGGEVLVLKEHQIEAMSTVLTSGKDENCDGIRFSTRALAQQDQTSKPIS